MAKEKGVAWVWRTGGLFTNGGVIIDPVEEQPRRARVIGGTAEYTESGQAQGVCYAGFKAITGFSLRKNGKPVRVRISIEPLPPPDETRSGWKPRSPTWVAGSLK